MFNVAFLSTAFLAAIGTLGGTFALPNSVSPDTAIEFAPGPGLPTLEDLGVTVADLMSTPRLSPKADQNNSESSCSLSIPGWQAHLKLVAARDLSKRYDNKCYPTSQAWFMYISRDPIYLCARYLEELGNQACVVPQGNWVTFCAAGAGLIRGIGVNRQQTQSTW